MDLSKIRTEMKLMHGNAYLDIYQDQSSKDMYIVPTEEGMDYLKEHKLKNEDSIIDLFAEGGTNNMIGNGYSFLSDVGLTACPLIVTTDVVTHASAEEYPNTWWYPDYCVRNAYDDIMEHGYCCLTWAGDDDEDVDGDNDDV